MAALGRERWRRAALAAAVLVASMSGIAGATAQPAPGNAQCSRDLLVADSLLRNGRFNLERAVDASAAERCAVWQRHVADMRRARAIYAACLTGSPRETRILQIDDSVAQIVPALRDRCPRG